jgi:hypothetical protein
MYGNHTNFENTMPARSKSLSIWLDRAQFHISRYGNLALCLVFAVQQGLTSARGEEQARTFPLISTEMNQ